jgi:GT2 family glycosyltransferase
MELSVIIVNYNVKHFLEQCLRSVQKASRNMTVELFVVDNNSVDSSCTMLRTKFPEITLIENKQNLGFAVANNQAIRKASGKYILLLNPDTVIEEDTLDKCVRFMNDHPDAGALGVKMIDGKGRFLPESKRSLPTPMVAFYKIFGLSRLFPRSRIFSRYHLGYLDRDQIHQVDVLPGAFMMLRREALDHTGFLDEDYFMYGEDVDISFRMSKEGYKNYYYPETTIIHYKGESTRKGSLNYVVTFYNAMIIFARKHFSPKMAKSYAFLINLAIYFRAFLAIARRTFKRIILPLLDALLFYTGFLLIKPVWEGYRFPGGGTYPHEFMRMVVPAYILLWIISLFFAGGYDKPVRLISVVKGVLSGTLIILVIYALLPESLRFSRALLLIGATWSMVTSIMLRFLLNFLKLQGFELEAFQKKRIIIIGREQEAGRVENLLRQADKKLEICGYVSPDQQPSGNSVGSVEQLEEIIRVNRINELIFCAYDISSRDIIRQMVSLGTVNLDYKIAPPESLTVIGSSSINTPGDLYLIDFNSLNTPVSKRNKRLFDVIASLVILALYPFFIFFIPHPGRFMANIAGVLSGAYSWVGYAAVISADLQELPAVKKGILTPLDGISEPVLTPGLAERVNITYARDYTILKDINILLKGIRNLGREPRKKS